MKNTSNQCSIWKLFSGPKDNFFDLYDNFIAKKENKSIVIEFLLTVCDILRHALIKRLPVRVNDIVTRREHGPAFVISQRPGGKDSGQWFVGGVTDELSRSFDVPMSFLDAGENGSWRRLCNVHQEDVKIHRCARACP